MKPQTIDDWLSQLGQPSADRDYKPGHARMLALLKPLHCKRPILRIRIAGTNGKGSTAFMLAAGLQAAGLKVGLYTSPHVLHFHERIRINKKPISHTDLWACLEHIMPIALSVGASYFEVATALALHHFSEASVDVEVLEAGVGAKLDATTAVDADMALITPIGLDHEAWLGNTLAKIAEEKAHALNACQWGFSAPQTADVAKILRQHKSEITFTQAITASCSMLGEHQKINAGLAYAALKTLLATQHIRSNQGVLKNAVTQAIAPARLQYIQYQQTHIWLDAAHNRHAIKALLPTLPALASPFDAVLVYTREDRSLLNALDLLRPFSRLLISNRGEGIDVVCQTPEQALVHMLKKQPRARILLLGSFTSVAAALRWLDSQSHTTTMPGQSHIKHP
ncbi:MAG: bifunctional folylpolyglutamate synthase/dihydrofolate synthase [Mariprofundaceae bacterium]|nr:bifunctional folylpolyglutamate synthase/dihydrofolate synthase [Mariprofundaceae bacterium]